MRCKFIKILILLVFLLVSGCSRYSYDCYYAYKNLSGSQYAKVNYTPAALKSLKESNKKYAKERREYRKSENKRRNKIYQLQSVKK